MFYNGDRLKKIQFLENLLLFNNYWLCIIIFKFNYFNGSYENNKCKNIFNNN